MAKYNPPRSPTALAQRRHADLQGRLRNKRAQARRRDRRRRALVEARRRRKVVKDYRLRRRSNQTEAEAADQTARRYQCSQSTVRLYHRRYRAGGFRALVPAYQCWAKPQSQLPFALIEIILAFRGRLGWCGQRIAHELQARGLATVSHMTIYRLFRRYHVKTRTYHPVGKSHGICYRRQQVKAPNWTWHVDFAGPWLDATGQKRSLLVVIDSYSRMLLALDVVEHQSAEAVEAVLARLFKRYGHPKILITDNGRAFAPSRREWQHRFGHFLAAEGVEHRRTKPYYPQTNGKAEAVIKTCEREFLRRLGWHKGGKPTWQWSQIEAERSAFQGWYNFYRSHSGLGYRVPSALYAGISLERDRLLNVYGLLPQSAIAVEELPKITRLNRMNHLSLALAS